MNQYLEHQHCRGAVSEWELLENWNGNKFCNSTKDVLHHVLVTEILGSFTTLSKDFLWRTCNEDIRNFYCKNIFHLEKSVLEEFIRTEILVCWAGNLLITSFTYVCKIQPSTNPVAKNIITPSLYLTTHHMT